MPTIEESSHPRYIQPSPVTDTAARDAASKWVTVASAGSRLLTTHFQRGRETSLSTDHTAGAQTNSTDF